ncbi:MAG: insulinase family protein, partial [Candidatus Eremiobacteraeota bacterium]|nr:insulinase family protein [Candidatus Eremiobacteraeota bacterium]
MNRKRLLILLFVLLWILSTGYPASGEDTQSARKIILQNGMVVITKEVHSAPVVSIIVGVKVGARNEKLGLTGISHFLEHMLFKGTKKFPPGLISKTLNRLGAHFNAYTSYDLTAFYETLPKDFIKSAMYIESDRLVNSLLDPEEFKHERVVVMSELEGGENDPLESLFKSLRGITFQSHPYHWPIIGYTEDVKRITLEDMRKHYKTYYVPNNAILVMVGDFETERAQYLAKAIFGKIPKGDEPPEVRAKEEPQRCERRVILNRKNCQPFIVIGIHVPNMKDLDTHALHVLDAMLTTGRTSRLYKRLVQGNLCVMVNSYMPTSRDPSACQIYARLRPGISYKNVEDEIWKEIEDIKKNPPSAEEMEKAKTLLKANFFKNCESASEIAQSLCYFEAVGDYTFFDTYVDKINKVTASDISRVARKYFNRKYQNVAWLIPEENEKESSVDFKKQKTKSILVGKKPFISPRACFSGRPKHHHASSQNPPTIKGFKLG